MKDKLEVPKVIAPFFEKGADERIYMTSENPCVGEIQIHTKQCSAVEEPEFHGIMWKEGASWRDSFDELQQRLIKNCQMYAQNEPAGMPGIAWQFSYPFLPICWMGMGQKLGR